MKKPIKTQKTRISWFFQWFFHILMKKPGFLVFSEKTEKTFNPGSDRGGFVLGGGDQGDSDQGDNVRGVKSGVVITGHPSYTTNCLPPL